MQPADVRVEFVARRLLPEADLARPRCPRMLKVSPMASGAQHFSRRVRISDGAAVFALDVAPKECGQLPPRSAFTRGTSFCRIPTSWGS